MIPLSLTLKNFLSYGEDVPPLDFTKFHVAVLSGANGHGKSALLDGLTYALWGEARKSSHDRKPDEGLLRLGAEEMRVEFCFSLDNERYRVLRAFRKGRRTNATQLELQIYESAANAYHSLSESAALSQTQARIDQLLSMNYTTFINSAFLVQGRADEFTQKNSRQRKEILTEILGLERYDRLADKAKERALNSSQSLQVHQQRIKELNIELADQVIYETDLKNLETRLQNLNQSLITDDKKLANWRIQLQESIQLKTQLTTSEQNHIRCRELHTKAKREALHLESQQVKDSEILTAAEVIQENFSTFLQLTAEESRCRQQMEQLHELQTKSSQLESGIASERHEVEKRCTTWASRLQALQDQVHDSKDLLAQEETIETQHNLLLATRQQATALEQQRDRHQLLQQEIQQLQGKISLEQERLQNRHQDLAAQINKLESQLAEDSKFQERLQQIDTNIQKLEIIAIERDRLKEAGLITRSRLDQVTLAIQTQTNELAETREKVRLLDATDTAACPLCGSLLDKIHRQQLDGELKRQEQDKHYDIDTKQQAVSTMKNQVEEMLQQYQTLDQQTQTLPPFKEEQAQLLAQRSKLKDDATELTQLKNLLHSIEQDLANKEFCPEARLKLGQIGDELERLNYQPEHFTQVQNTLKALAHIETDYARLQAAQTKQVKNNEDMEEANKKLALASKYLEEKLYAPKEQQDLNKVQQTIAALAYDSATHKRIRQEIDALSDAVSRRERLIAAQDRQVTIQASIETNKTEEKNLQKELALLEKNKTEINHRLEAIGNISNHLENLAERVSQDRLERDTLLQQQGALQIQYDRCLKWSKEQRTLATTIEQEQQQEWMYRQLAEAFGKDGIQALIIENAIPEIEAEANIILGQLTDNRIQITIESLRDLKKGGTRETLDIQIADEVGERSYHLYSGGEAFRTNFALRLALSKVLAKRSGTRLRTLIIDEGFGTQDSEGIEQLIQAIQAISKDFDKLLVVTHLMEIRNAFPVQIEITKHPDIGSRFELVDQR